MALKARKTKKEIMWNVENLLSYKGDPDNYPEVGRFLARKILSSDERKIMCWFPGKAQPRHFGRIRVPKEKEDCFRGSVFDISIFL